LSILITDQHLAVGAFWIMVVIALLITVVAGKAIDRRRRKREEELASRELAIIVEDVAITAGGRISMAMLVLTIIYAVLVYVAAKTVFQQIEAGVTLIGGSIIWGLGIAVGRVRTYRVYRSEHRSPH